MMRIIVDEALGPAQRVAHAKELVGDVDVRQVAELSSLTIGELTDLARIFATAERPVAIAGNQLSGREHGFEAVVSVEALNLIAGSDGKPGALVPQGSLPSGIVVPQEGTFADVGALLDELRAGRVQALILCGANPVFDLADNADVIGALQEVPFVVSFNPLIDETAVWADLVLPERTYLESWGYAPASPNFGLPIIGSQQPVVPPLVDARAPADALLAVARGIPAAAEALPWRDEVEFLKETVAQLPPSAIEGSGAEVQWARFLQHGVWWPATRPDPVPFSTNGSLVVQATAPQFQGAPQEYPYFLHLYLSDLLSDGRGASQPWLQGSPDPMTSIAWQTWVELHPDTARDLGVDDGDVLQVSTVHGTLEAPAYLYPAIRPDTVAIPIGQGHTDCGRYARDRGDNPMRLVGAKTDSRSGGLLWSELRAKVAPTGRRVPLALFESKIGVTKGFVNQESPG
jgi:anaerobic selenocysteine-containing dehydrogenase